MRRSSVALAVTLALAALGAIAATPAYVTSAINDPARKDQVQYDEGRHLATVMDFAQVKPGQKVIELVPASGYWTRVFSRIVGDKGHVYTVWPDGYQQYVEKSYAKWQGLVTTDYKNVSLIRGNASELKVPEQADLVFTNQNYHDYHDPFMGPVDMAAFDKKVFDALKPGGVFVIIDNVAPAGSGFADTDTTHRVDPEAVKKEVESAGFVFDGSRDMFKNPDDDHTKVSYEPPMVGKNDLFVFRFRKPMK